MLIYRRILLHSHVNEQPFTRSGGPVKIQPEKGVIVRAHMNTEGYRGRALRGSVADGFGATEIPDFAENVEAQDPQPPDCAL